MRAGPQGTGGAWYWMRQIARAGTVRLAATGSNPVGSVQNLSMRLLLLLLCLLLPVASAHALVREPVCARQDTINGWSRQHRVEALILRGSELNNAKKNMLFSPASLYVVLLWDESRVTAIQLDAPVLRPVGQSGRDERGIRWKVATGRFCK